MNRTTEPFGLMLRHGSTPWASPGSWPQVDTILGLEGQGARQLSPRGACPEHAPNEGLGKGRAAAPAAFRQLGGSRDLPTKRPDTTRLCASLAEGSRRFLGPTVQAQVAARSCPRRWCGQVSAVPENGAPASCPAAGCVLQSSEQQGASRSSSNSLARHRKPAENAGRKSSIWVAWRSQCPRFGSVAR